MKRWVAVSLIAASTWGAAYAQASKSETPVTFKSNPRLVVVDVVVTDAKGQPVTELTRDDFKLLEDGTVQRVQSFEAHAGNVVNGKAAEPANAVPKLAPNEYTNAPEAMPQVVNIVLLDMLNTPVMEQAEMRKRMLAFLKRLPPGQRLALFTLSTRLRMVQGVTGSSDALVSIVDKMLPEPSIFLKADSDRRFEFDFISQVQAYNPNAARHMAEFAEESEASHNDYRAGAALEALQQIARAVAAYPGRKNLVWVSGGFPLSFVPGEQFDKWFGETEGDIRQYGEQLRQTAAMLANSQVAVYPVDARGLMPFSTPAEVGAMFGRDVRTVLAMEESLRNRNMTETPDIHRTMENLAKDTGGKAFYNANDLEVAFAQSLKLGSTYYTVSYTPPGGKWDGRFRKIEVQLAKKGMNLSYRRGYFAVPDTAAPDNKKLEHGLETAMLSSSVDATAVVLTATVAAAGPDKVEIKYLIGPGQIAMRDADNHPRDLHLDFVVTAWDDKDHNTGSVSQTVRVPAGSPSLQNIEQAGLTKIETLTVKPGTTRLRVGVMDRNTGRIGTVEAAMPLVTKAEAKSQDGGR